MSYSIYALTNNCYEGTTCLINKLDIRDEEQLDTIESHITIAKISQLLQSPIQGDFEHYKAITNLSSKIYMTGLEFPEM